MADQVFAYILHKDGKADDTALELAIAAGKLAPGASVTAIVAGSGAGLDAVCNEVAAAYNEVWKIDNEALAYVNAEVLRPLLVNLLPAGSLVLVAHEHFGMDLAPGLSIKLDAAYLQRGSHIDHPVAAAPHEPGLEPLSGGVCERGGGEGARGGPSGGQGHSGGSTDKVTAVELVHEYTNVRRVERSPGPLSVSREAAAGTPLDSDSAAIVGLFPMLQKPASPYHASLRNCILLGSGVGYDRCLLPGRSGPGRLKDPPVSHVNQRFLQDHHEPNCQVGS